jgi:hypothetical protein
MKIAPLSLALTALLATALTQAPPAHALRCSLSGDHVRWAGHQDPDDARIAITTEDGKVTLLLTDRLVAIQLSDRMVHKVRRELRDKREEQDNVIGQAIVTAVVGTVGELIDNSFQCRLHYIRDAYYKDGRLVLKSTCGKPLFEDAEMDDCDVMSSFSERDAKAFIREFHRAKSEVESTR